MADLERIHELVALTEEVESLLAAERPRAALDVSERAVAAGDGLPDELRASALHTRARALDALGAVEEAERDLRAALELDPRVPGRWIFIAQVVTSSGRFDEARELLNVAIEVARDAGEAPLIPRIRWELAHLALQRGAREEARDQFERAVAESGSDKGSAAYSELSLARMDREEGNVDGARRRFARARELAAELTEKEQVVSAERPREDTVEARDRPREAAPGDEGPVLQVHAGDQTQLLFWPAAAVAPQRWTVPFAFAVHPRTAERLRWYVEDYPAQPVEPAPQIAAEVESELQHLGEALFDALLGTPDAEEVRARVREQLDRLRIEIVADSPAHDALPWELLRDRCTGADLALAARAFGRSLTAPALPLVRARTGPVRILLIISRPEGQLDVAFRSVADALVRELADARAAVVVDVLRPPTVERLHEVLGAAARGGVPYDVVHFDGHGTLDEGDGALVFQSGEAGDDAGVPVGGRELAAHLGAGGVRALVVNACRSAAGDEDGVYGSLARVALAGGLAAVVAMRFNVYVPTAVAFVGGLYRALAAGDGLDEAVTKARAGLAAREEIPEMPLVRDWCVPTLYRRAAVTLASDGEDRGRPQPAEVGLPPAPAHGFVGRDEVFVELEDALVRSSHVILRAVAGAGKTTLAAEFARWYARTGGCDVAGPYVGGGASGEEIRARSADFLEKRALHVWDDVRGLDAEHRRLLDQIARADGRVLIVSDRLDDPEVGLVLMPNLPREEGVALVEVVAAAAGAPCEPTVAVELARGLRGHALALTAAVTELSRRGAGDVDALLDELAVPPNRAPAAWTHELAEPLDVDDVLEVATLIAPFRGYVSVFGLMARLGDDDPDRAADALAELADRALLTRANAMVYAIHPGLPVALALRGRFEPPGRPFVAAVAEATNLWADLSESAGWDLPWAAEMGNLLLARSLASGNGWWDAVGQLLHALRVATGALGLADLWRREVLAAAGDFVDIGSGRPHPGMERFASAFIGHLASIAQLEGDHRRHVELLTADLALRRAAAADALGVAPEDWTDVERDAVRRVAVGLTNLGVAQKEVGDAGALASFEEAVRLAHALGDWRLEARNHMNVGVFHMVGIQGVDFEAADAAFAAGYELAAGEDAPLAGMLMTERGTVEYERGLAAHDADAARAHFERAAERLELATGLREPDAVLFHQLAQVYRHLGDVMSARAWFEQTIALREHELAPGAGADARLHLAYALEEAGLIDEALQYARSADQVLSRMREPPADLRLDTDEAIARLELSTRTA
jgi:tetratricopeptide (TPR) repeat protein